MQALICCWEIYLVFASTSPMVSMGVPNQPFLVGAMPYALPPISQSQKTNLAKPAIYCSGVPFVYKPTMI